MVVKISYCYRDSKYITNIEKVDAEILTIIEDSLADQMDRDEIEDYRIEVLAY